MTLFRFISRAALHIFGYRRLLVWNLLSCFIYVSCSMQMKQGVNENQNSTPIRSQTINEIVNNLIPVKNINPAQCRFWINNNFQDSEILYNEHPHLRTKKLKFYTYNGYTFLRISKINGNKTIALCLNNNSVTPDPKLLQSITDDIIDSLLDSNNKSKNESKEVNLKSKIMIFDMFLAYDYNTQKADWIHADAIHSGRFRDGNNLFHRLVTNIGKIDQKQFELVIEQFKLALDPKYQHTKRQLLCLKNRKNFTPFSLAIKIFCEKDLDNITEGRIKQILNIITTDNFMLANSNNILDKIYVKSLQQKLDKENSSFTVGETRLSETAMNFLKKITTQPKETSL